MDGSTIVSLVCVWLHSCWLLVPLMRPLYTQCHCTTEISIPDQAYIGAGSNIPWKASWATTACSVNGSCRTRWEVDYGGANHDTARWSAAPHGRTRGGWLIPGAPAERSWLHTHVWWPAELPRWHRPGSPPQHVDMLAVFLPCRLC